MESDRSSSSQDSSDKSASRRDEGMRVDGSVLFGQEPTEPPAPRRDPRLEIPQVLRESAPGTHPTRTGMQNQGQYAGASRAWGMSFDFISTILVGVLLGYFLDRWVTPSPVGTLSGLGIGFVLAFIRILKATQRESRAQMKALERQSGISTGRDVSSPEQRGSQAHKPHDERR